MLKTKNIIDDNIFKASILIVDDLEDNIIMLEQLLSDAGYTCISATTNPREVSELHRQNDYDLILLDLQMPGMDGFEVMDDLNKINSNSYIPVIVITAQPAHKIRALQAGAKDFISKPFDIIEVKTRIYNMLEVKLLYKNLEQLVEERTAQLRESEERYRSLTELSSDWYWEQDENANFTKVSGPVLELLGMQANGITENTNSAKTVNGWNESEREQLRAFIAARQPFVDYVFSKNNSDGSQQKYRVSGKPMFDRNSRFIGFRGIGIEFNGNK